jgi:hypothetical protein
MIHPFGSFILVAAVLAVAPARAETVVHLVDPQKFTDVGRDRLHSDRDGDLATLREALARRADALLPRGERLEVWITDVDQAGDFEPWRTPRQDLRIVRDIYPPRINLRFRWSGVDAQVRKEGERRLTDPAFLQDLSVRSLDAPMRYEIALLDRWLGKELSRP